MFDIISFGEYRMLQQAFNGLAAITATDSFLNMMKVGFLVGILSFGARALMTNRWDALPLLTGFIAYSVMFTPKVQVSITDVYGGGVVTVANVPIGLAAPLSVTSHVGRYLSSTFETAFSVITPGSSVQQNGYLEPLTVLLKMRDGTLGVSNSNNASQGDVELTLNEYLINCVVFDLELRDGTVPEVTLEKIKKAHSTFDALKTTFININVRTYLPDEPPQGTVRTCEDAYNQIQAFLDTGPWISLYYDNYLKSALGPTVNPTAGTAEDRVAAALGAIQLSSADARTFMVNSLLATLLKTADAKSAAARGATASAVTRVSAINQRNVQWAAEKTMFEKIARPVTAFIEVFMVCGGPMMAFAIAAFGPIGLSTLVKFLMMHVWVCLWAPTMTVCNMYIYTVISKWVTFVNVTANVDPISYGGVDSLNAEMQQWLAVGSMLAAATPTLTLMLIWGSNQVATTLASRMHGADHVDPTFAAPSLAGSAPLVQNQSGFAGNQDIGYTRTGGSLQSISINNTAIDSENSARTRLQQVTHQRQEALARSLENGISGVDSVKFGEDGTMSAKGANGRSVSAVYNAAYRAALDAKMSTTEAEKFAHGVTKSVAAGPQGQIGLSVGPKGAQVGFGVGGKQEIAERIASQSGLDLGKASAALDSLSSGVTKNEGTFAQLNSEVANSKSNKAGWSYDATKGDKHSRDWSMKVAESEQAGEQYQTAQQANRVLGNSTSFIAPQLRDNFVHKFGNNWASHIGGLYTQSFKGDPIAQQQGVLEIMGTNSFRNATGGWDQKDKVAVAQAMVLMTSREANNGREKAGLFADLSGLVGADRAKAGGAFPNAGELSHIAPDVRPGEAAARVANGLKDTPEKVDQQAVLSSLEDKKTMTGPVRARARDAGATAVFAAGVGQVEAANAAGRQKVDGEARYDRAAVKGAGEEKRAQEAKKDNVAKKRDEHEKRVDQ